MMASTKAKKIGITLLFFLMAGLCEIGGGIFVVSSIAWGRIVDKKKPDRYEIIGSIVAVFGAAVTFYSPR